MLAATNFKQWGVLEGHLDRSGAAVLRTSLRSEQKLLAEEDHPQ